MPNQGILASLSTGAKLAGVAVAAGVLAGLIALPAIGVAGMATKDATHTFNTLSVPQLGQLPLRSEILDSHGNVIAYYYPGGTAKNPGSTDRVPVPYYDIAPVMRNAIVAQEDARFWQHGALDMRGALRAFFNNLHGNATQGGSDLAQQYVKNALLLTATTKAQQQAATSDTLARKIIELRIAANVEHELTKQQLLAAYLNAAYFANDAYGIQVAARRYFSTTAAKLTLDQAAMLAGMVEFPYQYNPLVYPTNARNQRNLVLARMEQVHYITRGQELAAQQARLGLHPDNQTLQSGCTAPSAKKEAFFCAYVLALLQKDPAFTSAEHALNRTGGLKIYTTLNPQDQRAADHAVNFVEPSHDPTYNPNRNADVEVLIQPRTGDVRAIAEDRTYGFSRGQTTVNYAVNQEYGGAAGVQTGSSSKIFTLLTALKQGVPFGFTEKVVNPTSINGFANCKGQLLSWRNIHNAENPNRHPETFSLYTGTVQSINIFYAHLEQHVGLCNVVKTAASIGLTRANGESLFKGQGRVGSPYYQYPADDIPSFTLGSVYVSPMNMAAAYASVAGGGIYCHPVAIKKIVTSTGGKLPVQAASCHRAYSAQVADAANYILQAVLQSGTAAGRGIGIPAAGKTGTANNGFYAAFAGWTPRLAGYVSVFNPVDPTSLAGRMLAPTGSCYREVAGYPSCPAQMFGDNAPAATWQTTFLHLVPFLGHPGFPYPTDPVFFSKGNGNVPTSPPQHHHHHQGPPGPPNPGGHHHGGGGGGNGGH